MNKNVEYLCRLRINVPFLRLIPDMLYFRLDTSELYLPYGEIARMRIWLEKRLNSFVMTYQRDVFNLKINYENHICAHVKGAQLSEKQLVLLKNSEKKVSSDTVSFVAYQNPLEYIKPDKSLLYRYYQEKGLA